MKKRINTASKKGRPKRAEVKPADESISRDEERMRFENFVCAMLDPHNRQGQLSRVFGDLITGFVSQAYSNDREAAELCLKSAQACSDKEEADAFSEAGFEHIAKLELQRNIVRHGIGKMLADVAETYTADEAKEVFGGIVKMKQACERVKKTGGKYHLNRVAWMIRAYVDYRHEAGVKPSKEELKKYILAATEKDTPAMRKRKESERVSPEKWAQQRCLEDLSKYKDMPDAGDFKGWTRLYKASGLFDLEAQKPAAGKTAEKKGV